jgi:hypothetical protein
MNETIMKRLAALLSVKSIVTIVLTAVFAYLSIVGVVSGTDFLTVFLMVVSFYFGTQSQKVQDVISQGAETGEESR